MFSGLKGMDLNARYLTLLRDRIYARVIRELRHEHGLPPPEKIAITEMEFEIVWGLHASIFYIGIRKWIYGLAIPDDTGAVVEELAVTFLDGAPNVMAKLVGRAPRETNRRSRRRA
jgi:hypothetical protein